MVISRIRCKVDSLIGIVIINNYGLPNSCNSDDIVKTSKSFTYCKRFRLWFFVQLCSSLQHFSWHSASPPLRKLSFLINNFLSGCILRGNMSLAWQFISLSSWPRKQFLKTYFSRGKVATCLLRPGGGAKYCGHRHLHCTAAYRRMDDCLYIGFSSGPNARYNELRVGPLWEAFTFLRGRLR